MHDPAGALAPGSTTSVENQGLLHPNLASAVGGRLALAGLDGPVLTSGLPVASISGSVRPMAIWVFPIPGAEEEPLLII